MLLTQHISCATAVCNNMIGLIVSFLCGAVVTLLLVILGAAAWIYSHPVSPARAKEIGPYIQPKLPKVCYVCVWLVCH